MLRLDYPCRGTSGSPGYVRFRPSDLPKGTVVCSEPRQPTPDAFIRNIQQPMPLARKIRLLVRNGSLKIVRLRSCCGHPGEPGC